MKKTNGGGIDATSGKSRDIAGKKILDATSGDCRDIAGKKRVTSGKSRDTAEEKIVAAAWASTSGRSVPHSVPHSVLHSVHTVLNINASPIMEVGWLKPRPRHPLRKWAFGYSDTLMKNTNGGGIDATSGDSRDTAEKKKVAAAWASASGKILDATSGNSRDIAGN